MTATTRIRWAAIGAAVAVSLGAGGIGLLHATAPAGASAYVPISPCRLADTRPGAAQVGPHSGAIGGDGVLTFAGWGDVAGACDLPTATTGLQLNVTAVDATALTNLRFYPAGETTPTASNLNPAPGEPPTPNAVTVTLNPSGEFAVFNRFGSVHLVIDVLGYYTDHDHDDRYYTEAETDAAIKVAVDDALEAKADALQTIVVPQQAFRPADADTAFFNTFIDGAYIGGAGGSNSLYAPIQIPVGAAVSSVTYHFFDNTPIQDLTLEINRISLDSAFGGPVTSLSTFSNGSSPTFRSETVTPSEPYVVTDADGYAVSVFSTEWDTVDSALRIKGVEITYTLP